MDLVGIDLGRHSDIDSDIDSGIDLGVDSGGLSGNGVAEARALQHELIREHLKAVFRSAAFSTSKRAQHFLLLVVEHALAGRFDHLRERMIGAEMFGRPIDYDTANDAVVRVKATEVRRKLAQYYLELGEAPALRIEIPTGSYEPRFHWKSADESVPDETSPDETSPAYTNPAYMNLAGPDTDETISTARLDEPVEAASLPTTLADGNWDWTGAAEPPRLPGGRRVSTRLLVLCGVLLISAVAAGYFFPRRQAPVNTSQAVIHSIVVLPLENLSSDPGQENFADSITEELTSDLGQIAALRVISRTSAMTFKGTGKTLPQIARELGVDAAVEGSVARAGNQVRITAQLVDARRDQHLWAHSYTRNATDVLTLEGEVARAIADQVRIEITPQEQERLVRTRTINPEAEGIYFRGLERLNAGDQANAIEFLQKAIDKDPNYAQAHAMLANALDYMGQQYRMPPEEAFARAKAEALKAVELDDALAEGHAALGLAVISREWDWSTAEKEFRRALELNPNSANIRLRYGVYLAQIGRPQEAIAEARLAHELDPLSSLTYSISAFIYFDARQYDQAMEVIRRASELPHDDSETLYLESRIEIETGHYDEAIRHLQQLGDKAPRALGQLGNAYGRSGNAAAGREVIERLEKRLRSQGFGRYEIAWVYAGLGRKEEALKWLERAYEARDQRMINLKADPCMNPLRSDPRFQDLERRVGFPQIGK
jgi:TolB-like protein/Tfp pilus assembly protein PilF